jgi:DNA-binding CsgD family transcriptional regulator
VERVSVAAVDGRRETFRILAWDGKGIFASGTELPLATSTQVGRAATGRPFASPDFAAEPGWERPTDRLMEALGFCSGCACPVRDSVAVVRAVVSLSSTATGTDYDRRLDAIAESSRDVLAGIETLVVPELTRREEDVLRLLELGLRFKQVALELGISEATAKGYARDLFRKLAVTSRAEAVFEARRLGVLH